MRIQDLRIGNVINFESHGVVKEKIIDIGWFVQNESNEHLKYWKPIKITDEIISRLDTDFTIIKEDKGIRVFNNLFYHIEYLHELQNLWFAYWGKELKILAE